MFSTDQFDWETYQESRNSKRWKLPSSHGTDAIDKADRLFINLLHRCLIQKQPCERARQRPDVVKFTSTSNCYWALSRNTYSYKLIDKKEEVRYTAEILILWNLQVICHMVCRSVLTFLSFFFWYCPQEAKHSADKEAVRELD